MINNYNYTATERTINASFVTHLFSFGTSLSWVSSKSLPEKKICQSIVYSVIIVLLTFNPFGPEGPFFPLLPFSPLGPGGPRGPGGPTGPYMYVQGYVIATKCHYFSILPMTCIFSYWSSFNAWFSILTSKARLSLQESKNKS